MIGADTGTYSVKLVHLTKGVIQQVQQSKYPEWPKHSEDEVTSLLQRMVAQMGCRGERVWGSVGGTSIIAHMTSFPRMPEEELRGAVSLEAEQFMSRNWSEVDFDFDVLESLPDDRVRVLFVAAPRELSEQRVGCFKASGLYCTGIGTDSVALATAFEHSGGRPERDSVLLLNIGASGTSIALFSEGKLSVLRDVSFGGNDITQAIVEDLGLSFESAEEAKLDSAQDARVRESVERAMGPLRDQIARTIGYQTRGREGAGDVMIYLCGGGGLATGETDYLAGQFNVPVEFFDPFVNVGVKCELPGQLPLRSTYSVAVGNALLGEQLS